LDDMPHKWYKIEEACGHTFSWNEIKQNFIRYFKFILEEAHLREATQEIKKFLEKPNLVEMKKKRKGKFNIGLTLNCNFVSIQNQDIISTHRIDMEKVSFPRQSFWWKKNHPRVNNYTKIVYSLFKENKEDIEKPDFPPSYNKFI